MASHGVPRSAPTEKSQEAWQQELQKIEKYQDLEREVRQKVADHEYTADTLKLLGDLLESNPEYYTIWNYRRRVLQHQLSHTDALQAKLLEKDLQFLIPLLSKFPKCYWIWNYRLWLLDEARRLLPLPEAHKIWEGELALVSMFLSKDRRNFHAWGYRRLVFDTLKQLADVKETRTSMILKEFEYSDKKIRENLSNFSAWHYRTKIIQRLLDEQSASDAERKKMLDDELDFIHQALIDPRDQSLWFYHQNLMCVFDPSVTERTMAPNLSVSDRVQYLRNEIEFIEEMLDGDEDCKYIYQALIDCTVLVSKVTGTRSDSDRDQILSWLSELKKLDPLRKGRWADFEQNLS